MEGLFLTRVADVDCAAGRSIEGRFRRALQFLVILQFLHASKQLFGTPMSRRTGSQLLASLPTYLRHGVLYLFFAPRLLFDFRLRPPVTPPGCLRHPFGGGVKLSMEPGTLRTLFF